MDTHAIAQIQRGMIVIDRERNEIGKVEDVRLGDPDAVTTQGQDRETTVENIMGSTVRHAFGSDEGLPEELAARLLRTGYLRVDARGLLQPDLFVGADQVAQVENDTVYLSAAEDELARRVR